MRKSVAELFSNLIPDPWRSQSGFSPDIEDVHKNLFKAELSESDSIQFLNQWIQRFQPCLFGRIAAKLDLINYCILTENDLHKPDKEIKNKIQQQRLRWTGDGFSGEKSAFVIAVISPTIAYALPNEAVRELARRLCYFYLRTDIKPDEIYTDRLWLEKSAGETVVWEWPVGVNYFNAQGDKRWWQDHRIPGGMAFSMNSVGHMAKAGQLANALKALDDSFGLSSEEYPASKITSLDIALDFAMRTINGAADAVSGKATWLAPLPTDKTQLPTDKCPANLPGFLKDKNFCNYEGFYHTDITLPSEYFLADVERPAHISTHNLDFTYLFHEDVDNPDFEAMGRGRRIRGHRSPDRQIGKGKNDIKMSGYLVEMKDQIRLLEALQWKEK
jgi:hypothetical protein